jgi:DNA repair photolyase
MTLTTFDDELCRILEPNVCVTSRRIEVLEILKKRGIPTIVWMTPILPFINDTEENIEKLVDACAGAGVKGIISFGMGLTLREGDREYYYAALDRYFPGLKDRYIRTYGNAYELPSPAAETLMKVFSDRCRQYDIMSTTDECFAFLAEFPSKYEQLSLFDEEGDINAF